MDLKKIIVTSDLSTESTRAFEFATYQAKATDSELIVLHILQLPVLAEAALARLNELDWLQQVEKEEIRDAEKNLHDIISQHFPDQPVTAKVIPSLKPVSLEICDTATSMGVGLIVISSHGHGRLSQRLLGSTAERLIRESTCPVTLVPITEER